MELTGVNDDIIWSRTVRPKSYRSKKGYIRVYTHRSTRIYIKIWSGFLLRGITYFPTYGNFVHEIQVTPGLRIVLGHCPVLGPQIQQVAISPCLVIVATRNS